MRGKRRYKLIFVQRLRNKEERVRRRMLGRIGTLVCQTRGFIMETKRTYMLPNAAKAIIRLKP